MENLGFVVIITNLHIANLFRGKVLQLNNNLQNLEIFTSIYGSCINIVFCYHAGMYLSDSDFQIQCWGTSVVLVRPKPNCFLPFTIIGDL